MILIWLHLLYIINDCRPYEIVYIVLNVVEQQCFKVSVRVNNSKISGVLKWQLGVVKRKLIFFFACFASFRRPSSEVTFLMLMFRSLNYCTCCRVSTSVCQAWWCITLILFNTGKCVMSAKLEKWDLLCFWMVDAHILYYIILLNILS